MSIERTIGTLQGALPNRLANAVSDAMHQAQTYGMEIDEAACVAIAVIADYARVQYGDVYLDSLAEIVKRRAGVPLPEVVEHD